MVYSSQLNGQRATRRKFVIGGLIATVGAAGLLADFLYGGPIRNALYPQNTTRGREMSSLTEQITESSNATYSTSPETYTLEGRLFFDRGTSTFGTAGNGIQDDPDSEPGQKDITIAFVDPTSGEAAATATTDSSGDFKADLPKGNFLMYQFSDEFPYMCQSVKEVSRSYNIAIGENNPKLSIGLLQGFLSFPEKGIDPLDGYYDRDPRVGYTLAWNGATNECLDNDSGTHFLAEEGDIIPSFAPGFVTGVYPDTPDNLLTISIVPTLYNTLSYPHFDVFLAHSSEILVENGDRVSRYQPIAKAGHRGYTNHTVVHLGLVSGNEILDPYKPVFSMDYYSNLIEPFTYGCWGGSCPGGAVDCLRVPWLPLPVSQNENWQNYWIVEDQTQYGPPYS